MVQSRKLQLALGALVTLGGASLASAGSVFNVDFRVDITEGDLVGNTYYGSLSYDDGNLAGVGEETLGPLGGDEEPEGVLTFNFDFEGHTYTISDDLDYPDYPMVDFTDGSVTGVDYWVIFADDSFFEISMSGTEFRFGPGDIGQELATLDFLDQGNGQGNFGHSFGVITFLGGNPGNPNTVPTPTAAAAGLALLGGLVTRRSRKA